MKITKNSFDILVLNAHNFIADNCMEMNIMTGRRLLHAQRGSAPRSHCGGQGFDPPILRHNMSENVEISGTKSTGTPVLFGFFDQYR